MTNDESAIREVISTWMKASMEGDVETVLELMTDDVVFMVPGRDPFGKTLFASSSEGIDDLKIEGTSEIRELQVMGNWAFARTRLKVSMTPPGSSPIRREGYTLTIFHKQPDGRWLLARDANLLAPVA